ncbi:hypothetical protein ACO1M2_13770, partial [Staphylococcus aureus]
AVKASEVKEDKKKTTRAKRPVTVKTANGTEEAEVMQEAPEAPSRNSRPIKKAVPKKGAKPATKAVTEREFEEATDTNTP